MDYQLLRKRFLGYLNRNDCDDALADDFISQGIARVDRILTTPIQRSFFVFDAKASREAGEIWDSKLVIPPDYLGVTQIVADGSPVNRITQDQADDMEGYFVYNNRFHFTDRVASRSRIEVEYYSSMATGLSDGAITPATTALDDVIVFSALVYASIYFIDERLTQFTGMFQTLLQEAQDLADRDSMDNLTISPMYRGI